MGRRRRECVDETFWQLFRLDFETQQWEILADLPTGRSGVAGAALHGRLYIMGGEIPGLFEENEAYDPATDTWRAVTPMRTPRHGMGAATIGDSIYVIAGGSVEGWGPTNVNEVFSIGGEVSYLLPTPRPPVTLTVAYQATSAGSSPAHVHQSSIQAQRWRLYVGDAAVTWDGLAVVNMGDADTDVAISQFDSSGTLMHRVVPEGLADLAPWFKGLYVITDFDPMVSSYFEVSADQPLAITALRGTYDGKLLWVNPALPLD